MMAVKLLLSNFTKVNEITQRSSNPNKPSGTNRKIGVCPEVGWLDVEVVNIIQKTLEFLWRAIKNF